MGRWWCVTRDSQRSKVYAWEKEIFLNYDKNELSLEQCQALINLIWRAYEPNENPPELKDGRGTRRATGERDFINLPTWARNRPVVVHEVTHSLLSYHTHHGPEFMRLYIELLVRFGETGMGRRELLKSARLSKLKIGKATNIPFPKRKVWVHRKG